MIKWFVVGALVFFLAVVVLVLISSPEPPATLEEANIEQLELIEAALAAQDEAGRMAEESVEALTAHEEAWAKVEMGPQFVARNIMKVADDLDSLGHHTRAQNMRDEAWASFDANPLVRNAKAATARYQEVVARYSEADSTATEALQTVQDAGLWHLYEEAENKHLKE